MRTSIRSSPSFALVIFLMMVCMASETSRVLAATALWNAIVSPAGSVRLERSGKVVATLTPGLFEHQ